VDRLLAELNHRAADLAARVQDWPGSDESRLSPLGRGRLEALERYAGLLRLDLLPLPRPEAFVETIEELMRAISMEKKR
jgi:hypothetical protein